MNKLEEIKKKRVQISKQHFEEKCFVCKKLIKKGLSFHHVGYRKDEKRHSNFKSWIEYNEYVLPIIQKNPNRFALLCQKCHRLVSILQAIKGDSRFDRLVTLASRSR